MPNGGSDCCGTCWFNARNKGDAGYDHADDPEPDFCTIRGFMIDDAFYTYCGNHPYRRPNRDPIPIGPVFVAAGELDSDRLIWRLSPDTEEIRLHLLELLSEIQEQPAEEYPLGICADELVVWQLGEFREHRAVTDLQRLATFRPEMTGGRFGRTRYWLVDAAVEALRNIGDRMS